MVRVFQKKRSHSSRHLIIFTGFALCLAMPLPSLGENKKGDAIHLGLHPHLEPPKATVQYPVPKPYLARKAKVGAYITTEITVDQTGKPIKVEVLLVGLSNKVAYALSAKVRRAIKKSVKQTLMAYRFEPIVYQKRPVSAVFEYTVVIN